ncbi:MAG: hypothetical protein WD557_01315 [Dehalococcoidia bacterium]
MLTDERIDDIWDLLSEHAGQWPGTASAQGGYPHPYLKSVVIETVRLVLSSLLVDEENPEDGTLEYRGDTDKARLFAAGAWDNLATEGYVDAHLADASDAHDASAISVDSTDLVGVGTDVQAALEELDDAIADHTADTTDAHDASAVSVLDSGGNYVATDAEAALAEVMDALQAHGADTADAHDASGISILDAAGDFTATDVEGALAELQADAEAHLADAADAHDASAISVADAGGNFTGTDVEAVLAELFDSLGGGGGVGIITDPSKWLMSPGYEYWAGPFGDADAIGVANMGASQGWTAASLITAPGGTGDLNASGDDVPFMIGGNVAGSLLTSPIIFGGYSAFQVAEKFLGSAPTKLCCEFRAQWTVASANETDTYIGFIAPATTDAASAGSVAAIVSDGTNFRLRSDNGDDAGAAIDTAIHTWRIEVGPTTTEWFIDGVSQGTITTEADIYPTSFKFDTGTTNRVFLAWARVYYE